MDVGRDCLCVYLDGRWILTIDELIEELERVRKVHGGSLVVRYPDYERGYGYEDVDYVFPMNKDGTETSSNADWVKIY